MDQLSTGIEHSHIQGDWDADASQPIKAPWQTTADANADIVIVVMGVTGSGKSSFIKLVTGRDDVVVGDTLNSETNEIRGYEFHHKDQNYILVDTPGFDDTNRQDSEITKQILEWLSSSLTSGQQINGVIYLHRIIDPRMGGTALRNNRMFQKLVGDGALRNVTLGTTFWEAVPVSVGARRERELRETADFWGAMIEGGADLVRLKKDRATSLSVIERISRNQKVVFQAQNEMANGKSFAETAAAQEQQQQAARLKQELQLQRERERKQIQSQLRRDQERRDREYAEQLVAMERKLEVERAAEEYRLAQAEREARERAEQVQRDLEREMERLELERKAEIEELERLKQKEEEEEAARVSELRDKFYREYECIGLTAQWPCDRCKGKIFRYTTYYHCCFCDSDRYFHCGGCGNDCGDPVHPFMTKRISPDDCIVM